MPHTIDPGTSGQLTLVGLTRCTEILDCGPEADEVLREGMPLDTARRRFRTVFRGEDCGAGLEMVELLAASSMEQAYDRG